MSCWRKIAISIIFSVSQQSDLTEIVEVFRLERSTLPIGGTSHYLLSFQLGLTSQYLPQSGVYAEADFYYERDGLAGICVFRAGSDYNQPNRK